MQLAIFIKEIKTIKEKKNPATKVFQALRIEVNSEIDNLQKCLESFLRQDLKSIEILLYGNNFNEQIIKIVHKLESNDIKIRLINKEYFSKKFILDEGLPVTTALNNEELLILLIQGRFFLGMNYKKLNLVSKNSKKKII